MTPSGPEFAPGFGKTSPPLLAWRRDVRRFRSGAVPEPLIAELLDLTAFAPSVGNCQPTRFVRVDDPPGAAAIEANFERANRAALTPMRASARALYAQLKLAGLKEAPVHLAVFCDEATELGHGLGARTMPETRRYSAVCALHTFWLAAARMGLASAGCRSSTRRRSPKSSMYRRPGRYRLSLRRLAPRRKLTPELERAGWQARVAPDGAAPVRLA